MKLMMLHRYLDVVSIQSVRGGRVGVYVCICHCYLFVIPLLLLMIFVTCIRVSVRNETTTQDDE